MKKYHFTTDKYLVFILIFMRFKKPENIFHSFRCLNQVKTDTQ